MVGALNISRQSATSTILLGAIVAVACFLLPFTAVAQQFTIEQKNDSLWVLSLDNGGNVATWKLPYQVYRFATADVNNDGIDDALVGVYTKSRFFTEPSRRVFIFKNYHGLIRPLWLSSRLGGELIDFTVEGNKLRAIEVMNDGGEYFINDYAWQGFGMGWTECVASFKTIEESYQFLNINKQ